MLESSLTVAWFRWTNQNSFATHSNQWGCLICIDNRSRQMASFVFVKESSGQRLAFESCWKTWNKRAFWCGSLFLYYIKQIDSMSPCVCSVTDHRRRQNVLRTSVIHSAIASCATFLFLPHCEVIRDYWADARHHGICLFNGCTWEVCYASFVLSNLPCASIIQYYTLWRLPFVKCYYETITWYIIDDASFILLLHNLRSPHTQSLYKFDTSTLHRRAWSKMILP